MSENQLHQPHKPVVVGHTRVLIENRHGEKLVGILHETGSRELVILCHGFRSSKDRIPMVNLSFAFEREKISAFRFDFAGNGESEGSFQYGNYCRESEDLRAVVEHFQGEQRFIAAIIGHSKGGNAVLLYASRYSDVQIIVNIAGRFNLKRGIEGRLGKYFQEKIERDGFIDVKNRRGKTEYRVTKESLMDRLATDTRVACQTIPLSCRVLTVHGTVDEFVLVEDAIEFAKYIPNHNLCIVQGADHEYTKHQSELASIVLNFVKTCLCEDKMSMPKPSSSSCTTKKIIDPRNRLLYWITLDLSCRVLLTNLVQLFTATDVDMLMNLLLRKVFRKENKRLYKLHPETH